MPTAVDFDEAQAGSLQIFTHSCQKTGQRAGELADSLLILRASRPSSLPLKRTERVARIGDNDASSPS